MIYSTYPSHIGELFGSESTVNGSTGNDTISHYNGGDNVTIHGGCDKVSDNKKIFPCPKFSTASVTLHPVSAPRRCDVRNW